MIRPGTPLARRNLAHTVHVRRAFGIARIVAAATGVAALVGEINFTIGTGPFAIANFFSYFTVQSMILAVIVFVLGAANALRRPQDTVLLDMSRVLATAYVTVSGLVFAAILVEGNLRGVPVWAPWSSLLLHFVLPAYALLDWFLAPGRIVPWRTIPWSLAFPAAWVLYTLVRGAGAYWYPYYFLDPALVQFPLELGLYLLVIVAIFSVTVAILIAISRRHHSPDRRPGRGRVRGWPAPRQARRRRRTPRAAPPRLPR